MKPTVLHLLDSFHHGGSERQAVQLVRLLRDRDDCRVEVACLDGSGPLRAEVERLGLGEIREYQLRSFYDRHALIQLRRFARWLGDRGVDIVQTHDFYTNVFGMAGATLARVPVRIAARREIAGFRSEMQRRVERAAYRLAHAIVANAEAVKLHLVEEGVREDRIVTIHNGVDMARLTPPTDLARAQALAALGLPPGRQVRVVTIVANLHNSVKDHPTFLRAAWRVREAIPEAAFVIAGEGPLQPAMRALAIELGLGDEAFFIGRCERLATLLAVSEVCVLSSRAEGFPNAILEYMAAARPVVATDVGGAREAIVEAETGHLVAPGDDQAMAERVVRLLRQPGLARAMGERGRRRVAQHFSCEAQRERTQALYDRLLARAEARRPSPRRERLEHRPAARVTETAMGAAVGSRPTPAPLRVLLVAPSLDMLGGQSRQAARLLERLREEPSLEVGFLPINPRLPGVWRRLQAVKYVRTVVTAARYWVTLLARVPRCEVVHVFSAAYYAYVLAAMPAVLVGRLFGKKVILNYRSGEAEDHLRNWRLTARPTIHLAHRIVVPSGYLVEVFARAGVTARAIFNMVELDRFPFRERRPLRPVFLTSRLLEPLYNVGCVLRAFALIQERYPEAQLTVAGEGWQRRDLERLARDLGLRRTEFVGRVPFERMPALYGAADIYLTATDIDNMPSSIVESLASGLPVVTTDAGGITHIVSHEETCLMVPRGDHRAMAAAALRLLEDGELAARIARRGREHCRRFTWESVREEWLRLYRELVPAVRSRDDASAARPRRMSAAGTPVGDGEATR